METTNIEVLVTVAVSENGRVDCCIDDEYWVQQQEKHAAFMNTIRSDKQLWACKTVRVHVPIPIQFEDLRGTPEITGRKAENIDAVSATTENKP